MNIKHDTDFESLDIAMLALMAAEDVKETPVLIDGLQSLRYLTLELRAYVTASHEKERREQLLHTFFKEFHFRGNWENYYAAGNCMLDEVLRTRQGLPVTLGILLIHMARSVELSVRGVCFPGNFLVHFLDENVFVDPFTGQIWDREQQGIMLRAALGDLAKLEEKHLASANHKDILSRLLNVSKGCLLQERFLPEALRCSEILLAMHPDDPYEIRDRGLVYEQLECPQLAAQDYSYFIEQCPKDPVASVLKVQLAMLDHGTVIFH